MSCVSKIVKDKTKKAATIEFIETNAVAIFL